MRIHQTKPHSRKANITARHSPALVKLLQDAIAMHQQGRLDDAADIYTKLLAVDADHFDALHLLGMVRRAEGRLDAALALFEHAARINPSNNPVHANHGNALLNLGRHEEALACYDRFLRSVPDFPEVLSNRGNALAALMRNDEAMASYQRALELQPDFIDAYFNRGNLYMEMRRFAFALDDYERVLQSNPDHFQALNNHGNALVKLERLSDAMQSYLSGLRIAPDNAGLHFSLATAYKKTGRVQEAAEHYTKSLHFKTDGFAAQNTAVQLAILHYLYGNQANVPPLLDVAKGMLDGHSAKDPGSLIYCVFMLKIVWWWQQCRAAENTPAVDGTLYVVGESHILSAHNVVVNHAGRRLQCKGFWIEGCTQWLIGNQDANHFKQLTASFLQSFPVGATVLITVGEIDCRIDGGIFKAWKKAPTQNLKQLVSTTTLAYLMRISAWAKSRQQKIIVNGVPACNLPHGADIDEQEMLSFLELLRLFNATLHRHAIEMGMDFLDVFSMTDAGNAMSNEQWHIDAHHLRPDGVAEAFCHYLILSKNGL